MQKVAGTVKPGETILAGGDPYMVRGVANYITAFVGHTTEFMLEGGNTLTVLTSEMVEVVDI